MPTSRAVSIVPSLLQAIVHVDGEAMVMHAGDKPYVIAMAGQVDLASRGLTLDAVNGIVSQLLPPEFQAALDEFGAVQYELAAAAEFPREHFTVVAARGGNDVWVEIRRRRLPEEDSVAEELFTPPSLPVAAVEESATVSQPAAGSAEDESASPGLAPSAEGENADEAIEPSVQVVEPLPLMPAMGSELDVDSEEEVIDLDAALNDQPYSAEHDEPPAAYELVADLTELSDGAYDWQSIDGLMIVGGLQEAALAGDLDPIAAIELQAAAVIASEAQAVVESEPEAIVAHAPDVELVAMTEFEPERAIESVSHPDVAPESALAEEMPEPVAAMDVESEPIVASEPHPVVPEPESVVAEMPDTEPVLASVSDPELITGAVPDPEPIVSTMPGPELEWQLVAPEPQPILAEMPESDAIAALDTQTGLLFGPEWDAVVGPAPQEMFPFVAGPVIDMMAEPDIVAPVEPLAEQVFAEEVHAILEPDAAAVADPEPLAFAPRQEPPAGPAVEAASTGEAIEAASPGPAQPRAVPSPRPAPQPAIVLPMSRSPIRADTPPPDAVAPALAGLEALLRIAAARGASTLYLSSETRPSVRVDGEVQVLEGEPTLTGRDVESLLLTLMPERSHEALRTGAATEWICDIEGVGRVRCMSFRDHLGPGGVFRLIPARSVSAEQLGLSKSIQALAIEPEGLVLVAGPRSSGKRTLMAAFVDLINRTRRDHVITIEREINVVHDRNTAFISQREVRGSDDDLLAAARAALREDPDVLVIEELRTGGLMTVALEAASSGHLVIGGFSAHTATAAIDRIIDLYGPEYRHQVQLALADTLRGVIVQVLMKKSGGGRVAAREVLLNTPAVANVLAEGKTSQLPMAIEGGRRHGMVPLNDALVGFVQNGTVEAHEAYRHSPDRSGFLALLKRRGIDTSFAERLA